MLPPDSEETISSRFCFPYAGGGASLFRDYHKHFPADVEICPIQYPGRENLRKEKPHTSIKELVADILPDIEALTDVPYIFFGYSFGALVAFEVARELCKNKTLPVELIVAAHRSPHLPDSTEQIHTYSDEQMLATLKRTMPDIPQEIWDHPEIMKAYAPMIRGDVTMSETYIYTDEAPLPLTIFACGSSQDQHVSQEEILAWQKQTSEKFHSIVFPGNHFFIHEQENLLLETLLGEVNKWKANK